MGADFCFVTNLIIFSNIIAQSSFPLDLRYPFGNLCWMKTASLPMHELRRRMRWGQVTACFMKMDRQTDRQTEKGIPYRFWWTIWHSSSIKFKVLTSNILLQGDVEATKYYTTDNEHDSSPHDWHFCDFTHSWTQQNNQHVICRDGE